MKVSLQKKNRIYVWRLLKKAALQAHPEALFTLAICLIRGYGTMCNKRKGIEILRLAAEKGNNDAKEILNQYANESK